MRNIQAAATKMHGMNHPAARLTDDDVILARELYKPYNRECGVRALAKRFGVSYTAMQAAIDGRTWQHLAG